MQLNIVLNKAHGKIEGDKNITLSLAENLTLNFACIYPLRGAAITINGTQHRLDGNLFTVPRQYLTAAELKIAVGVYKNGAIDRIFEVEPITLRKMQASYEGHKEFDELLTRVAALEKLCNELQARINNLTDRISGTEMF